MSEVESSIRSLGGTNLTIIDEETRQVSFDAYDDDWQSLAEAVGNVAGVRRPVVRA